MRRVAIVQARMGSSRLPGKVLRDLAGAPMLQQLLRRLDRCRNLDEIVVATTTSPADDAIVELVTRCGVLCCRGSETDVLARYLDAARATHADVIVRVTSDCPLIDAVQVDRVVDALTDGVSPYDYAANMLVRTFPRGLDTEAFFMDTLERLARIARSRESREHVTWFITDERPDLWLTRSITDEEDNSDLRWTVDTADDLALVERLYRDLALPESYSDHRSVVRYVRAHPEIAMMNAHVRQKAS